MTSEFIRRTAATVVLSTLAAIGAAGRAQAHVTVQPKAAPAGSQQTLRFVVGHGCDGQPTTGLRVEMPPGVEAVEPQPKAGWTVTVRREGASGAELVWSGGAFPAHEADGFEVKVKLPAQPGNLAFPAFQSCGAVLTGWTEAATAESPKPSHPVPVLVLASETVVVPPSAPEGRPEGVTVRGGVLADPGGLPLYTFDFDTMVGMSHCVGDCASTWRPFKAAAGARPVGDWALIGRDDGSIQWTYKTKPVYTYAKDAPGGPATGEGQANWRPAR